MGFTGVNDIWVTMIYLTLRSFNGTNPIFPTNKMAGWSTPILSGFHRTYGGAIHAVEVGPESNYPLPRHDARCMGSKMGLTFQPKYKSELVVRPRPCYAPEARARWTWNGPKVNWLQSSECQTAKSSRSSRKKRC